MTTPQELIDRLALNQEQYDKWQLEVDDNPDSEEAVINKNLWLARKQEIEFAIEVVNNL